MSKREWKWETTTTHLVTVDRGDRRCQVVITSFADGARFGIIAVEIPISAAGSRAAILEHHAHQDLGVRKKLTNAYRVGEKYLEAWLAAPASAEPPPPCSCTPIEVPALVVPSVTSLQIGIWRLCPWEVLPDGFRCFWAEFREPWSVPPDSPAPRTRLAARIFKDPDGHWRWAGRRSEGSFLFHYPELYPSPEEAKKPSEAWLLEART